MKRKIVEFLIERRESGQYRYFSMKQVVNMDSEYDERVSVPDGLEQHQTCGGTMPYEDRSRP